MNNKKMLVTAMTIVSVTGLLYPATAKAASDAEYTKDENVYVKMDSDGEINGTYVVNTFTVTNAGEITDFGKYEKVKNLTNLDEITEDKDEYSFYAEKGKFYYQGNIANANLPWEFDVNYVLDDKDIKADDLAGAEGDLEIHLNIKKTNDEEIAKFLQAYMLQIKFTLDNDLCKEIEAEGASIVNMGSKETISYNIMSPDAEIIIKANVTDFEMDDISITGAPMAAFPMSFVSDKNENMRQTMFLMSVEGIEIEEEEVVVVEEIESKNPIKQMIDRFINRST